jgi:hypothetical protein
MFYRIGMILLDAFLIAKLLYELVAGKALSPLHFWIVDYTRDEKPAGYWLNIGIDFVILVILLFMTRCFFTKACDSFIWSW